MLSSVRPGFQGHQPAQSLTSCVKRPVRKPSGHNNRQVEGFSTVCAHQQAPRSAHQRHLRAVELRRGDLTWTRPPWYFDYSVTAESLQLQSIKEIDSKEASNTDVKVQLTVSPAGAGYFVTGDAIADLPLHCDCCLATFRQPVAAPIKLWLDASIAAHVIPHDPSQLPFPAEMSAVDLGPAVSDAIILMMPSANLCGRPECNVQYATSWKSGASGWSATPILQRAQGDAPKARTKGPFSALHELSPGRDW